MLANTNGFVILLNVTAILSKILFGVKKNDFTEFFWPLTEGVLGVWDFILFLSKFDIHYLG